MPTQPAGKGDATTATGGDEGVRLRDNPFAHVPAANTAGTLLVAVCGRGHQESPARCLQCWWVALSNKFVASAAVAVAADVVEGHPVLFLKTTVTPAAVEV